MKSHPQEKHDGQGFESLDSAETADKGSTKAQSSTAEDHLFTYSCNALALGLLYLDFVDARLHADRERIIRLYSLMMLYFKLAGTFKYAYYDLYTLAEVSFFLPPELADMRDSLIAVIRSIQTMKWIGILNIGTKHSRWIAET